MDIDFVIVILNLLMLILHFSFVVEVYFVMFLFRFTLRVCFVLT